MSVPAGPGEERALLLAAIWRARENIIDLNVVVEDKRRELANAEVALQVEARRLDRLLEGIAA